MKPERKVEIQLWDWLKTQSNNIKEVYFNSKNEVNAPIFKVNGIQEKPDLIVELKGNEKKFYAIEVKDNSKSRNVIQAFKIIEKYYKKYINKKTKYYIKKREIKITGFLIATQGSLDGFLFHEEDYKDNWHGGVERSKYQVSKIYKIIPRMEGRDTFRYVRILWNNYGEIRDKFDEKPAMGILIGNTEDELRPYIQITNYNLIKKRWGQKWQRL